MRTKNNIDDSFGKRLAFLRNKAGYTLRELAKETGISHRMLCYYEAQGGRIPADTLSKIADALDVTTDDLLGRNNGTNKIEPKNKRLFKKLAKVETLPVKDREIVIRMIDGLLVKNTVKK